MNRWVTRSLGLAAMAIPTAGAATSTAVIGVERPLQSAVRSADTVRLAALLDGGADPNQVDALTRTALHYAAALGDAASVAALLSAGAAVNVADREGYTPLMRAAQNTNPEAARLLLEAGANPALTNAQNQTALDLARTAGAEEVIELLP